MGYHVHPFALHDHIEQLHMLCNSLKKQYKPVIPHRYFLMEIVRNLLKKSKDYDAKRQVKIPREEVES